MSAETIVKIVDILQSWPAGLIVVLMLVMGPWLCLVGVIWLQYKQVAAQDKRAADQDVKAAENMAKLEKKVEAGWRAYEDNVMLVKETQEIARQVLRIANELADTIHLSTQVQTQLVESIKNNLFCPLIRKEIGK